LARKRATVQQLAFEAGIELDDALITLWDAGFSYVNSTGDLIRKSDLSAAKRALGLATRRELSSPRYWLRRFGVSESEFTGLLTKVGFSGSSFDERLSKKAINRLKAELRNRGLSPYSDELAPQQTPISPASSAPLQWRTIGHERDLKWLSAGQVLAIHNALVDDFSQDADPIDPPGVRGRNLLESAVFRPQTAIAGKRKYPTVEMSAAALLHSLVHDHPFHNGNKRTALVAMLVFLDENGFLLTCDQDSLFKLVLQLAQHALVNGDRKDLPDREALAVADWIASNARWMEKGDRPLPFRRLRRILTEYGCDFQFPGGVGNRINITRTVERRTKILGRKKLHVLRTQTYYGDEGSEIDRSAINKIRHDLELDDMHGIDSRGFYDRDPVSVSEFIVNYRKTLRRLARL
jgi:death-on-curing family protein